MHEYVEKADLFLSEALKPGVLECKRPTGEVVRYDPNTLAFGILSRHRYIKTFFKPIPCNWIAVKYQKPGSCHGQHDNLMYWQESCSV